MFTFHHLSRSPGQKHLVTCRNILLPSPSTKTQCIDRGVHMNRVIQVTLPEDGYLETLKPEERVVKGQLGQNMIFEDLRPQLDALARWDDPDVGRAVMQAQYILTQRQRSLKTSISCTKIAVVVSICTELASQPFLRPGHPILLRHLAVVSGPRKSYSVPVALSRHAPQALTFPNTHLQEESPG